MYPGTYLKTEPFEIRYKVVADYLKRHYDTSDKTIVDINCGEPLFAKHIAFKRYVCNDIFVPDNTDGLEFLHCTDTDVNVKPDVLCIWGYGGAEHTGNDMESKTAGKTIVRLAEYKPDYIILEMAQKWENDYKIMSNLKAQLEGYEEVFEQKLEIEPKQHYHDKRQVSVLKRKMV